VREHIGWRIVFRQEKRREGVVLDCAVVPDEGVFALGVKEEGVTGVP
jgi:hypothetical protein